jgi:hypothetical protein
MSKSTISQYFNPDQHLVLHQDKEGNMIGGGYHVNNLLYKHKMPLFVSLDDAATGEGRQSGGGRGGSSSDEHFIPEKFSDLFKDLAVPAGLFMMPSLFKPRNYAFEVPEAEAAKPHKEGDTNTDTDDEDAAERSCRTKPVPNDIFDTLLSLVTPSERIHHDVKTRRQRQSGGKETKRQNKTKRSRA